LHLRVKLGDLLLDLLFGIAKIVFNGFVFDGDMLFHFSSLFSDELVE
jgi:hypothetical protein